MNKEEGYDNSYSSGYDDAFSPRYDSRCNKNADSSVSNNIICDLCGVEIFTIGTVMSLVAKFSRQVAKTFVQYLAGETCDAMNNDHYSEHST